MICLECKKTLNYIYHKNALDIFGLELCTKHKIRLEKIIKTKGTSKEVIQLYYGLKDAGLNPMLEWWDGTKSIDIAISRVKLNIEVSTEYHSISHEQAIIDLEEAMHSFKNGFTTIRIPQVLIKYYLKETVINITGIVEGLKANIKAI
ncbi:hypothetical protein KCTC52924_03795 [Arenibacter antarcticus]|uniref:Uncharacterized protein n=1 Tax=Arenibacter antarcticus TaxID=2040469 RepID=A0ABW5VH14_9FLAO|nr:hypothetical protein [Arenibacter sp. H213]MCM4168233.1 hypothetical protein [Arenibacter sp. H213]